MSSMRGYQRGQYSPVFVGYLAGIGGQRRLRSCSNDYPSQYPGRRSFLGEGKEVGEAYPFRKYHRSLLQRFLLLAIDCMVMQI